MEINWFTVIAQVINFFVLVWLLKRYLYQPVLKAIDAREKKIADQLEDAAAQKAEATKEQEDFRQKNESFDQQKEELLDKAVTETQEVRQKLLEKARQEADALQAKLEKASAAQQQALSRELAQKTKQEVFSIARKALTDLASVSLETQSVQLFIQRLKDLPTEEKQQFMAAFQANSNLPGEKQSPIEVYSAFEIPEQEQEAIKRAVEEILGPNTQFQFATKPALISGIELTANGYKLTWSMAGYVDALEKYIAETVPKKPVTTEKKKQHAAK